MKSTLAILVISCLFVLSLQSGFQCNVQGCQYCSYPNSCGACQNNYVLMIANSTGAFYCGAVTCTPNCQTCYQNNTCQTCASGYFITSNGSCSTQSTSNSSMPPNCLWASNSENCTVCAYGYSLQAGFCYPTITKTSSDANCMIKLTSYICQICSPNYIVSPIGMCVSNTLNQTNCNIQNCAYCTNANSTCTLCMPGFQLTSSNTCTNNTCAQTGCMACASNGQCSTCMVGYTLNSQTKTCQLVGYGCNDPNCQICSAPQSCGQCKPGYQLANYQTGIRMCRPLTCPYNVTNCMTCTFSYDSNFNFQKPLCSQCNSGYILVNGFCVANLTTYGCSVGNCLTCSYTNFCSVCKPGFSLSSYGTCLPTQCSIPNCVSCSLNFICQQCNSGYTLALGPVNLVSQNLYSFVSYALTQQCIPNTISCNVANCAYCLTANTCASCATGFDFTSSNSNACSPACNVTNCLQCNEGNTNTCASCMPGYQSQSNGTSCTPISYSCNSGCTNQTCIYNWANSQAECTGCQSQMTLYMGVCYPTTCNLYGCSLCASWATPAYCMQCNQGLILSNGYCIKLNCNNNVANCITCIQNGACVGCAQGFLLTKNSSGTFCVASPSTCLVDNCLECSATNNKQCISCAQPYNLTNGMCVCGFQNCLSCKQTSLSCDVCPPPLFSSMQTLGCVPAPSLKHTCNVNNCMECLTETQCSLCAVGYQLNPSDLSCMLNNCSSLGFNNCQLCDQLTCHLCQTGYMVNNFLEGGQCLQVSAGYTCNITGCAVCNSANTSICLSCLPTYTANGNTQCLPNTCNISNCYLCLQNNFCTVCLAGYFLTTSLTCQPMFSNLANCQNQIQYCSMCVINLVNNNNQKYCIKCQDGFEFDSTNTVCIPQTNSIPNCKVQTSWGFSMQPYCQVCEQGYYVNTWGLCSQYNPATNNTGCTVYNCLYCATNSTQCSFCFQPWGINTAGQCQTSVFCSANCQYCVNSSVCLTCASSYSLSSSNQCVLCSVTGCKTCNQQNVCATCNSGYSLTSAGSCLLCSITNCAQCSDVNYCQSCNAVNGTQLSPSTNGGSCYACNTSLTNMANCASCNGTNSCGQCQNGYQIYVAQNSTSGVCVQCNIQNCQYCAPNGTAVMCQTCAVGYSTIGGNCVQCQYPCVTCTSNQGPNNCATCSTPYYFQTATSLGTCVVNLIPNCITYNPSNVTICTSCSTGYTYNSTSNTCVFSCPSNCQSCSSSSVCTTCISGFYLTSSNSCSQCQVTGCSVCTNNGNTCTTCFQGFYVIQGECKTCPGYCSSCTSNSTCQSLTQSNQQVLMQIGTQTVLAVCQQSCKTCSNVNPQICLQCQSGFFLNQGNCFKCSSNCLTCNSSNVNQCLSCYTNNFLSGSACSSCSSNCLTCAGANDQSKCLSCPTGYFLSNSQCVQGCPLNCLTCSGSSTCTKCISGYTLFTQGSSTICAPCTTSCRTCVSGQPASCLSCGAGFYLSGSSCVQCSVNCLSCSAAGCTSCIDGYFLTSAQTCSQNCQLPCATCSTVTPTKCTSCIAGYSYNDVSNTCNQILTCTGGCSACPLGYSLNQGQCVACTANQCQTCNATSPGQCYSCLPGFYLNSNNQCSACPSSCATCLTGNGCLTCASGFTQIANAPITSGGYQCVICNSPCATCINSPDYCTSCIDGYQFFGWKCAQSFYFGFSLTLLTSITTFNQNYYSFILALTNAIGGSNPNAITILSITGGSVVIQGGAGPNGGSGSQDAYNEYSSLSSALSQNNEIAGMKVGQSSVTVVGGSVDFKKVNLALILGICIPVGVLLISGIVLYVYCKKKRSADVIEQKIKEDSGFTVRESFELSSHYKEEETRRPFEETTGIN